MDTLALDHWADRYAWKHSGIKMNLQRLMQFVFLLQETNELVAIKKFKDSEGE